MTLEWFVAPPLPRAIEADFPYRRKLVRVAGRLVHFVDDGEGPAILLCHGNPTWSYLWREVIRDLLVEGARVIAPDLIGLGLSEKPTRIEEHSMEMQVQVLTALVDELGLERLTIVGQDMGGPVVTGMAARRPGLVVAAMFCNTAFLAPKRYRTTPFHRFSRLPLVSEALFRLLNFPVPFLDRVQGVRGSIGPRELEAYRYPLRDPAARVAPLAMARMVPNHAQHPSVALLEECTRWAESFRGPVSLVWGMRDPVLGKAVHRLRKVFPQATLAETSGGHFLPEEFPHTIAHAILRAQREALADH